MRAVGAPAPASQRAYRRRPVACRLPARLERRRAAQQARENLTGEAQSGPGETMDMRWGRVPEGAVARRRVNSIDSLKDLGNYSLWLRD